MPARRQVSPQKIEQAVALRVLGRSLSAIAKETGIARSTLGDLLRAPDVQAMIEDERSAAHANERAERERAGARERQARHRERKTREEMGVAPSGRPQERPVKGGADGRVLGVIGLPRPAEVGRLEPVVWYARSRPEGQVSYEAWLGLPKEAPYRPSVVVTPNSRLSFDALDVQDVARVATLAAQELGLDERDVRAALAGAEPGRVFRLVPEDESAPEAA